MRKVEKRWRIYININKNNKQYRLLYHEPTEKDIEKFVDDLDLSMGEVHVEYFYHILN